MKSFQNVFSSAVLMLLLVAGLSVPAFAAPVVSPGQSVLITQAADADAAGAEEAADAEAEEGNPEKTTSVEPESTEGKIIMGAIVVAVLGLFVLIFIKASKLD